MKLGIKSTNLHGFLYLDHLVKPILSSGQL